MMLKTEGNASTDQGNGRFVGYCKDMIDLIAEQMNFEYDLHLVEDGIYGKYDKSLGRWTGIIGELIQGVSNIYNHFLIMIVKVCQTNAPKCTGKNC